MAKTCFNPKRQSPTLQNIVENVESFFNDPNVIAFKPYFVGWDESHPDEKGCQLYVCDYVSEMFSYVWERAYHHASPKEQRLLDGFWDRGDYDAYDEIKNKIADRYEHPVHCCIRAAMDVVYDSSAGVLGFTAGNIRAMYPEGVPKWIVDGWERPFELLPDAAELVL